MTISIDWGTRVITVNKVDMTLVATTPYDVYELDLDTFRLALRDLEDGAEGMHFEIPGEGTIAGFALSGPLAAQAGGFYRRVGSAA